MTSLRAVREFKVIDSHSGGAPSRLVLSGVPQLAGATVMEMMHDFAAHRAVNSELEVQHLG